ncbi:MAG: MerR family transcriptional regulator [Candidatus Binatia bacterium]
MKTLLFPFSTLTHLDIDLDTYDSKTASRIVGVSLRQLQYWDEQDFLRPSIKLAGGRGTQRLYSFHDLVCLKVVKDLARYGFSLKKIRRCLRPLQEQTDPGARPPESLRYLTDGEELFVLTSDRQKIRHVMECQFLISLGIGSLVRELDGAVRRFGGLAGKASRATRRLDEGRSGSA